MLWEGYAGRVSNIGGAIDCDGAMQLQWLHEFGAAVIAEVILGQNMDDSAWAIMGGMLWCAAWWAVRQSYLSSVGTTIQPLYMLAPLSVQVVTELAIWLEWFGEGPFVV